jgi:uncharacterized 2Fe-2S/4Fe-4S cluster protein (DUF4445 family)
MRDPSLPLRVDLEPVGRRAVVEPGTTLLGATRSSGVALVSVCGGMGTCGSCRVRLVSGDLSPLTLIEEGELSASEIEAGYRLACQSQVMSDVRVDIPPESLSATQRLQIEGQASHVQPDPPLVVVDVRLMPATLTDLRADSVRLKEALADLGYPGAVISFPVLADCSDRLHAQAWSARLALRPNDEHTEVIAVLPPGSRWFGLALDIGTTKLAAYLVDLSSGLTVAKTGAMNPQIAYGEDVVSRIAYANISAAARQVLQARLVEALNRLVDELCVTARATPDQVVDGVAVGNTAMHHLFAGLPVRQLGESPYVAAVSEPLEIRARDVGLRVSPGAALYLPPNIAGYVGADHVAMLLASGLGQTSKTALALDIGTNTEISLAIGGRLISCSCASGPAFEGAHIRDGMRAVLGAIERVRFADGAFQVHTIGEALPVGICGSGILDAIAEALAAGMIDHRGVPRKDHPLVAQPNGQAACLIVPASGTGHGRDILMTRGDINEIQLAKGAIRAGIDILLAEAGLTPEALDEIVVAGAFGTYLDIGSAIRVGMLPDLPRERFRQVGNAAGLGAQYLLISRAQRVMAQELAGRIEYVELTAHSGFTDAFVRALYF